MLGVQSFCSFTLALQLSIMAQISQMKILILTLHDILSSIKMASWENVTIFGQALVLQWNQTSLA